MPRQYKLRDEPRKVVDLSQSRNQDTENETWTMVSKKTQGIAQSERPPVEKTTSGRGRGRPPRSKM